MRRTIRPPERLARSRRGGLPGWGRNFSVLLGGSPECGVGTKRFSVKRRLRLQHEFQGVVEVTDYGRMVHHEVFVPEELLERMPGMRERFSAGKRRGLADRVASAVQERFRRRGAEPVVDEVREMEG